MTLESIADTISLVSRQEDLIMYVGSSDAFAIAEEISDNAINGNWSIVVEKVKELNPVQAMYVFGLIDGKFMADQPMLNDSQINSLMRVISNHLND